MPEIKEASITIKFLQNVAVKDHNGRTVQAFDKGETVTMCESSANHWLTRGKAATADQLAEAEAEAAAEAAVQAVTPVYGDSSKSDLLAMARDRGLAVKESDSKASIIELLESADLAG